MRPSTVLVVEDNPVTRKLLRVTLQGGGYDVLEAGDGRTALELAERTPPALVLLDLVLSDMGGIELARRLRTLPPLAHAPILAVSGIPSKIEEAGSASDLTDFLLKPVEPSRLLRVVRTYLPPADPGSTAAGRGRRILVADDEPSQRKLLALRLGQMGFEVATAPDGQEALERARAAPPDAIVSDVLMPRLDGFELAVAVTKDPRLAHVPVVLASSSYLEQEDRDLAIKAGAAAFVVRTPDFRDVIEAVLAALAAPPPSRAAPAAVPAEHTRRVIRQLERQVSRNQSLAEQSALQAAELAVLGGIAEALARARDPGAALADVLARCLDAGGISEGALYMVEGRILLHAQLGFEGRGAGEVESLFGHEDLLRTVVQEGAMIEIPSARVAGDAARDLLERSGCARLLLMPVMSLDERLGVLLMGSASGERRQHDWIAFARAVALQVGQALALTRAFSRLAGSEERFRALVENSSDAVSLLDREGKVLYASRSLRRVLGYEVEEFVGRSAFELMHPDDLGRVQGVFAECLASPGRAISTGVRYRHRDGSWRDLELVGVNRLDEPNVAAVVANFRDVTERKREEAVRSALYRIAEATVSVENMGAFYAAIHAIVGELMYARNFYIALHDEAADLLRFPYCVDERDSAEPIPPGKTLTAYVLRTGRPLLASPGVFSELRDRGEVERVGIASVDWLGVPLERGEKCFGVLVVQSYTESVRYTEADRDVLTFVARHVAAAIERKRAFASVIESETLKKTILDAALDCVIAMDAEGRITEFNASAERTFGYRRDAVIGRPLAEVIIPARLRSSHQEGLAHYLATGEGPVIGKRIEVAAARADGTEFPADLAISVSRVDGRPIFVGSLSDVTERKRAEEELLRQREALYQSEKLAAMGTLLAGVAHELNNPLSVVIGHAGLLRRQAGDGPTAVRAEKLAEAADRCARIVANFLALARQRPPERRRTSLNEVVHEAVELVSYGVRVDGVDLDLELAAELPALWADPHQLHQVVVNLVTNAHHALRSSPPPRRITIATRVRDGRLMLDVADTGPGMPAEIRSRVFDPFFTTKPPGQGTGLGLSLCQGIVESHGGTISVESEPGRGAVFRVEMPVQGPPPAAEEAASADVPPAAGGKRILVVDDELALAEVLAELLAEDGHSVVVASSGQAAIEKLGAETYDVVVSDMKMPGLDGPALHREVERLHPQLARRFVFLTGDLLSPETREFLETAGVPSLEKPVKTEDLRRMIRQIAAEENGRERS